MFLLLLFEQTEKDIQIINKIELVFCNIRINFKGIVFIDETISLRTKNDERSIQIILYEIEWPFVVKYFHS